ncbi:MAG TPA: hypothetical protein VH092_10650 [Urbifossiella sp.]|nr:hypothetical protein [Urbifossiella sp.]
MQRPNGREASIARFTYRQFGDARAVRILKDAFADGPDGLMQFEQDLTAPHYPF